MKKPHLVDGYSFTGFTPYRIFGSLPTPEDNRIVNLKRNQKKLNAFVAENHIAVITTRKQKSSVIYPVEILLSIFNSNTVV